MTEQATALNQSADEVLYDVDGHIATITLNAPDRMNTISGPMLDRLTELLLEADTDRNIRCIIITGTGRAFCAGLDLSAQTSGKGLGGSGSFSPANLDLRATPPTVLHKLDTPTIAAINGGAAGYGMDTALGCDMRIMADTAKMAPAFCKRGVLPESGGTWFLPRLVGWAKASELIFTGRTLLADDCAQLGLTNYVVPAADLMSKARALADEVAANAPLAVQASKRMMRMGLNEPFDEHVHHVFLQLLPLMQSADAKEGMLSFLEKRAANFEGK